MAGGTRRDFCRKKRPIKKPEEITWLREGKKKRDDRRKEKSAKLGLENESSPGGEKIEAGKPGLLGVGSGQKQRVGA